MTNWLAGRVIENRHWTNTLFSLRVEAPKLPFQAGQFVGIALDIGGERVARAFSLVNPSGDPTLEFYGVIVSEGPLSPRLASTTIAPKAAPATSARCASRPCACASRLSST